MSDEICLNEITLADGRYLVSRDKVKADAPLGVTDIAPFVAEAQFRLADNPGPGGGAKHKAGRVFLRCGNYTVEDDVNLGNAVRPDGSVALCEGTIFDFEGSTILHRKGAAFWIGGPRGDMSAHWRPATVWGTSGPLAGRSSFYSRAGGRNASIRNYDSLAVLTERDDWTGITALTIDLSLGRETAFSDEWHSLIGFASNPAGLIDPFHVRFTTGANGNSGLDVRWAVQDAAGRRYQRNYRIPVPGWANPFTRRDLSMEFVPATGTFRAWVDRVSVPVTTSTPAGSVPAGCTLASNLDVRPFSFPHSADEGRGPAAMVLHGLRVVGSLVYGADGPGGVQRYIAGQALTDANVFHAMPAPEFVGGWSARPGTVWTMRPAPDGRSFVSMAEGNTGPGVSRSRVFVEGPYTQSGAFPDVPAAVRLRGLRSIGYAGTPSQDSGRFFVPIYIGRCFQAYLDRLHFPDGVLVGVNAVGVSCYPVTVDGYRAESAHTHFVARFFSPTIRGLSVRSAGRAVVRSVTDSGCTIEDFFIHESGNCEGIIVVAGGQWETQVSLIRGLVDQEGSDPVYPFVYVRDIGRRVEVFVDRVNLGAASTRPLVDPETGQTVPRTRPIVHVDRRHLSPTANRGHVTAVVGSILGHRLDVLKCSGDASGVSVRHAWPTESWNASAIKRGPEIIQTDPGVLETMGLLTQDIAAAKAAIETNTAEIVSSVQAIGARVDVLSDVAEDRELLTGLIDTVAAAAAVAKAAAARIVETPAIPPTPAP